jgi:hypothetical protein
VAGWRRDGGRWLAGGARVAGWAWRCDGGRWVAAGWVLAAQGRGAAGRGREVAWCCCLGLGPYHLNRGSGLWALFAGLLGCKLPWAICILGYFNSGYPTGYPQAGQNTCARTRLGSGRVRVRPAGEKSCPCPSPSGRVPSRYPLPVPELPSLRMTSARPPLLGATIVTNVFYP